MSNDPVNTGRTSSSGAPYRALRCQDARNRGAITAFALSTSTSRDATARSDLRPAYVRGHCHTGPPVS
ncbi:hypothetical protein LCL61_33710, partial [Amycolatopsis coloradensis]